MGIKLQLKGKKFNRLTVISNAGSNKHKKALWLCRCICGNELTVTGSHLVNGNTNSCGCYQIDRIKEAETTHGHSKNKMQSPEYHTWCNMRERCNNPDNVAYFNYGGRGIEVCKRWLKFENFLKDMGLKPSKLHSIERVNNNENYCPSNCIWDVVENQSRNHRRNKWFEYNGQRMIQEDWAKKWGVNGTAIKHHLNTGKTFEQIYTFYTNKNKKP
jgi:hypothetical protein